MSVSAFSGRLISLLFIFLLMAACSSARPVQRSTDSKTVFFNSFESAQDTMRWYWNGQRSLVRDTPPEGGITALRIAGKQALPVASFLTRPVAKGGYFMIECWGKMEKTGGFIQLSTVSDHQVSEAIQVEIIEPEWRVLRSGDILFCPPNTSLMLTMQAGTVIEGSMLVDMLRIVKVPEPVFAGK
ncbi:MAG TPA: hypothetical protein PKV71_17200 [Calditrichia bacterium]|nr:hypothetical protein [Calditrichota bacterium]HQU71041.1 hypothetical protein [Calditrichia bacterium]HQV33625.1 hypothetical protein [Calditrichia bacterium]